MKKRAVLLCGMLAVALLAASCGKEKTCRCTVLHEQSIRIIKIDKGDCEDLRYVLYDRDPVLYPNITDSVLCTDYDFGIE